MGPKSFALALIGMLLISQLDDVIAKPTTVKVTWAIPPSVPSVPAGRSFSGNTLTICAGDKVAFAWNDGMAHGLGSTTASKWASCSLSGLKVLSPVKTTGSKVVTFAKPGTFYYLCQAPGHCLSGHKMKVVVGKAC